MNYWADRERLAMLQDLAASTTRDIVQLCNNLGISYVRVTDYKSVYSTAKKKKLYTSNNVLLHEPRTNKTFRATSGKTRVYICWRGESVEEITLAFAYVKMTGDYKEFYLVKCKCK